MPPRRQAATTAGLLLVLAAAWAGTPGPAPAATRAQVATSDEGAAATGPGQVATETTALLGDFDGDKRKDLFWYGPGAKDDHLWLGRPDRNFVGSPVTVGGSYAPLVADFDGDARADILWYGPGAAYDTLWLGRPGGQFAGRPVAVNGTYQPITGDFDGDARADIFWYGPGAAPDRLWLGGVGGRFAGVPVTVNGTYQPFTGDFDGDGRRDIFWYAPGAARDSVWFGGPGGDFTGTTADVTRPYQPLVADFGGDTVDDVLWWAPGPANDVLWFGHPDRRFTSRSTTVDLDYARAPAISPGTLAERYDPYGFVAHALGSVDGLLYTNTLEAFQRNYGRGFRVFEADHVLLADGTALVAHDRSEGNYNLDRPFRESTWADLVAAGQKYQGTYTILRSQDVLRLMADHPDIYVIGDFKWSRPEIFRAYVRQATAMGRPDLLERLLPHVAHQDDLNAYRAYYPMRNYVLALYFTQAKGWYDDAEVVDLVGRNRTPAVMMWWRDRDPSLSLADNGRQGRRYRQPFVDSLRAAGAVVYVHSLADPAQVQRFWDLGIGVYSDEPFPPLGGDTAQLRAPQLAPAAATPPA